MKNVKLSLFTAFLLLIIGSIIPNRLSAQERCSTPPLSESQKLAFEDWMQQSLQAYHRQPAAERVVFTIPVIVHIVHSDGEAIGVGTNLAQERVISQLDVLNEDFRRRPNTPGFNNHPAGADVEIEFCLADRAPDGSLLPEPGIDRVNRNLKGWVAPPYSQDYAARTIRPGSIWDPYRYFNIWVCELSGNTLGFAEYPVDSGLDGLSGVSTNDSNDGVVISTKSFGRDPENLPAPYNLGRSTTHEVGHWLGLFHIWGDASCGDDFCGDTPTAEDAHYGCPRDPFSCNSIDMYENYMDYTDDRCMNVFTLCQRERMRAALLNGKRRKELLSSDACTPVMEPPTTEFGSNNFQGCPGLIVRFVDQSSNRPSSWEWSFPGGTPATSQEANPVVVYNEIGSYDVQLITQNAFGTDTLRVENYIDIKRGTETTVFYKEDFETGASGWTVENPDGRNGWELIFQSAGSQNGSGTMRMQCWDYSQIGERDYLISPAINLRDRYNISLQFDHAYRQSDEGEQDSLLIRVSTDNGQTFPHRVFAEAENGRGSFATNPPLANDFIPLRDEDWCYGGDVGLSCISLDLNEFQGFSQLRLRFETYNAGGNSLFIDNIQLRGSCLPNKREDELVFRVFPNPTSGDLELEFYQESQENMRLSLLDLLGRKLWETEFLAAPGDINRPVQLQGIAPGTYFLQLRSEGASGVKKIVIW